MIPKILLTLFFSLSFFTSCVPVPMEEEGEKTEMVFTDLREKVGKLDNSIEASRDVRFGDRFYLESVLEEIFGPSVKINSYGDQSYRLIFSQQGTFGGGCDYYSLNYEETGAGSNNYRNPNKRRNCFLRQRNNHQIAKGTTVRAGYMIKMCEHIVGRNSSAKQHAYGRAEINPSSDDLNFENVNKLYKLFYPVDRMPASISKVIDRDFNNDSEIPTAGSLEEKWNTMLLAFCVSPGWQIP